MQKAFQSKLYMLPMFSQMHLFLLLFILSHISCQRIDTAFKTLLTGANPLSTDFFLRRHVNIQRAWQFHSHEYPSHEKTLQDTNPMNRTRNLLSFGMSAALDQPRIMKPKSPIVNRKLAAVLHNILSICSVGQENCRPPRPRSSVMDSTLGGSTVTSSIIPLMMRIRHCSRVHTVTVRHPVQLLQPSLGHQSTTHGMQGKVSMFWAAEEALKPYRLPKTS